MMNKPGQNDEPVTNASIQEMQERLLRFRRAPDADEARAILRVATHHGDVAVAKEVEAYLMPPFIEAILSQDQPEERFRLPCFCPTDEDDQDHHDVTEVLEGVQCSADGDLWLIERCVFWGEAVDMDRVLWSPTDPDPCRHDSPGGEAGCTCQILVLGSVKDYSIGEWPIFFSQDGHSLMFTEGKYGLTDSSPGVYLRGSSQEVGLVVPEDAIGDEDDEDDALCPVSSSPGPVLGYIVGDRLHLWHVGEEQGDFASSPGDVVVLPGIREQWDAFVHCAAFDPSMRYIALSHKTTIELRRVSDGACINTFESTTPIASLDFEPDGRHLIVSPSNTHLNIESWRLSIPGFDSVEALGVAGPLCFSPSGGFVCGYASPSVLSIWQLEPVPRQLGQLPYGAMFESTGTGLSSGDDHDRIVGAFWPSAQRTLVVVAADGRAIRWRMEPRPSASE